MKQLLAYAMFAGGMIGVGIFGLPYVLVRAGVLPTFLLTIVVLIIAWVSHLAYADVVLRTKGKKRLPGYIGTYLGKPGFLLTAVTNILGFIGALLAYAIVGGSFVSLLLAPWAHITPQTATLLYLAAGAVILLRGVKQLPVIQLLILALFLVTLVVLGGATLPLLSWGNLPALGQGSERLLPYGVLLFAFWGLALIPELIEMSGRRRQAVRRVLAWTLVTAAVAYALFVIMIAGVSGQKTTEDALSGIAGITGPSVLLFSAFFGILTTFSSFLALGLTLIRTLVYDFHLRPFSAWSIAIASPLVLFLLGVHQFVRVLSVTGAIFIGLEGILVLVMFWVAQQGRSQRGNPLGSPVVLAALGVLLLSGVVAEVVRVLGEG